MRKYKNIFNIVAITIVLVFLGVLFASAQTVPRFKIAPETNPTIVIDADKYAWKKATVPPKYNPKGKMDPFENPFDAKKTDKIIKDTFSVPKTRLTVWNLSQLKLTSTVINGDRCFAAFNTPADAGCAFGNVGDYIGKAGYKIVFIKPGKVVIALGDDVKTLSIR